MKIKKLFPLMFMIGMLFFVCPVRQSSAGFESASKRGAQTFQYELSGDIEVKPTLALFPITISTGAKNYRASLESAQQIVTQLEGDAQQADSTRFSVSPADFDLSREYAKVSVSFFGGDETPSNTRLEFFLRLQFSDDDPFWERAALIADALDILQKYATRYQKDDEIHFIFGDLQLHIDDKEQYREQIVNAVYLRARQMVDVIGTHEQTTPKIKEIRFDQTIQEEILNLHKGALSLNATIVFEFEPER